MFWHESATQVFALLFDIVFFNPGINKVGYDDACHFGQHVRKTYKHSADSTARRLADPDLTDYWVDKLHFKGHVGEECRRLYNPADRAYLQGVNTQIAEHNWVWLNRYRHIVRTMSVLASDLVLMRLAYLHNLGV